MAEIIETGRGGYGGYYRHPMFTAARSLWHAIGTVSTIGWIAFAAVHIGEHLK